MVMNIAGITCKKCGRNETELEHLGIAMNIALETCNECLKKAKLGNAYGIAEAADAPLGLVAAVKDSASASAECNCQELRRACLALLGEIYVRDIVVPELAPHVQAIGELLRK